MGTSSKSKSLLVGLAAIAAASCGSPGADTEHVAVQAEKLTGLVPYRVRIQMIRVTDLSYSPASLTSALVRVNQLWAPLGIQFDFNHADVVNRPDADCSSTASLSGIGNAIYGYIPLFICDDSASGPDHNSVKWEPDFGSENLAHELGHYFDLDHTHGSAVVLEDQDWPMKDGKRNPDYISVETCIRAKFQNLALPLRCPNLALGTAIRDALLDGDGLPDTAISIEIMPPRLESIRCSSSVFPLRVRFTDGRADQDYSFLPGRDNLMGYLFCGTWNVKPSQLNLVRTALLTGKRSHLIRPFVTRETSFADTAGWNAEQYYATIGFPNVSGVGGDDVCGRGKFGITCATSDAGAFTDLRLWTGEFDDANGWNRPEHYRTIRYPNVNGGPADVCGRGIDGVYCAKSNGSTFGAATRWTPAFSNNDGFTAEKYYSTVEFPNVSASTGNADVCGRRADGLWCGISNGSGFSAPTRWEGTLSDANGFDQPMYYRTIKYPNLNNSGGTDMCVRGTAGIYCALSNGSSFPGLSRWTPEYSNTLGWSTEKFYSTIQFADINGDGFADVCGRAANGLYCGTSNGSSSFGNFSIWGPDFSDTNGWSTADSYQTITFVDLDRDGKVDACGRVKDKLDVDRRGFYCAYSTGSAFTQYGKYSVSPSDQFGWSQPQYYRTLKFANIDGDAVPELCARGVFGILCEP